MNQFTIYRRAFSLVELSIVLVILGLLVGGVLSGQSLIHAAELRSITSEQPRWIAAANTFRDKYFAWPGDLSNATSFWGIAAGGTGNDATCMNFESTDIKTCNGNGDGHIAGSTGSYEWWRFWQHLANAGLIEGTYSGYLNTSYAATLPRSKFSSNVYWLLDIESNTATAGSTSTFNGIVFGSNMVLISGSSGYSVMTPADAWNIDTKMDDGLPGTGKIWTVKGANATNPCTTKYGQIADTGALYNLTFTGQVCSLYWVRLFGS